MATRLLRRLTRDQRGATAAEYALLISLIAVVIFAGVTAFGTSVAQIFGWSCDEIASATSGSTC